MGNRAGHVDTLLSDFPISVATSICLLEFKATIIQECITIHANLSLRKRFTLVRDSLLEKRYRQVSLRAHIFNNLVNVHASSFDATPQEDERLATKARLLLEQIIPRLYDWFLTESVDAVLEDDIECTRATDRPDKRRRVTFRPNLPRCVRGKNKNCSVEAFIRRHSDIMLPALRAVVKRIGEDGAKQLARTIELFERVVGDPETELSHGDCRSAGDCLIALEGAGHATHALSTNATEWSHLCEILGMEFVPVRYPGEKTR